MGPGIVDELRNCPGWERWIHDQGIRRERDTGDGRNVLDEMEIQVVVERRVDGVRRRYDQQRVTIGGRAHHGLGADVAARTWPVLDNERLAKSLGKPLRYQACKDVRPATCGLRHDH